MYIYIIATDRHEQKIQKYKNTAEKNESPTNYAQSHVDVFKIYYKT